MEDIVKNQEKLYLNRFLRFGDDPRSLLWSTREAQYLRFQKLTDLFKYERDEKFSVHDVGCGLAHLKEFLDESDVHCEYSGSDIVPQFIETNKNKYPGCNFFLQDFSTEFDQVVDEVRGRDYYVLIGTFNCIGNATTEDWESFIFKVISNMHKIAVKGICFNFLTKYSDYYEKELYYASPERMMEWCLKNLGRFVVISHDLPVYEFFVTAYKEGFLKKKFPDYKKYFKGV